MVNKISKKGIGRCKQFLTWLFLGKKLLLSDDHNLTCPRCRTKMKKIEKHSVTIDVCPFCEGLWLDNGEIDKLNNLAKDKVKIVKKKTNKSSKKNKL